MKTFSRKKSLLSIILVWLFFMCTFRSSPVGSNPLNFVFIYSSSCSTLRMLNKLRNFTFPKTTYIANADKRITATGIGVLFYVNACAVAFFLIKKIVLKVREVLWFVYTLFISALQLLKSYLLSIFSQSYSLCSSIVEAQTGAHRNSIGICARNMRHFTATSPILSSPLASLFDLRMLNKLNFFGKSKNIKEVI